MAQHLKLRGKKTNIDISGVGETSTEARYTSSIVIKSLVNGFSSNLDVVIIPSITSYQPSEKLKITKNLHLADESFDQPGSIDLLIGAEFFYNLLLVGQIELENTAILQKTKLGWVVAGCVKHNNNSSFTERTLSSNTVALPSAIPYHCLSVSSNLQSLDNILKIFWKLEHYPPESSIFSLEEQFCEKFFDETTTRCPISNKFIVRLPFKEKPEKLGLANEYTQFIDEYISLAHMKEVSSDDYENRYFIPHHCVIKPDSTTTRLRVVFDASCYTSNGKSLNDILCVGPTIQNVIFNILSRFRFHKYVLVADITKTYRQVLADERDARWQSIVWRKQNASSLTLFQLQTVTYGTSSAPYLTTICLARLAQDEVAEYPLGAAVVAHDFYVDNMMTGADDISKLIQKKSSDIAYEDRESIINVSNMQYVKTLGLRWSSSEDEYSFDYNKSSSSEQTKKRKILSYMAAVFDPLGLINPIVVKCKILMQGLWSMKLNWDESVPQDIFTEWEYIKQQSHLIGNIKIPRC
ncbi:uncharacterized protein LOC142235612 [Haematobia irritans]|uniref:uncharacterized protein LOC142235612 n=1 Tax=Haematobia irritans TaxID=7368 RepID=UPI003F5073F3